MLRLLLTATTALLVAYSVAGELVIENAERQARVQDRAARLGCMPGSLTSATSFTDSTYWALQIIANTQRVVSATTLTIKNTGSAAVQSVTVCEQAALRQQSAMYEVRDTMVYISVGRGLGCLHSISYGDRVARLVL